MKPTLLASATAVLLTAFSAQIWADLSLESPALRVCDSLHPDIVTGAYDGDIRFRSLDDERVQKEQVALQEFYKSLEGHWQGEQIDRVCLGTGDRARAESRYFVLKEVETAFRHDGLFTLRSDKHRVENPANDTSLRTISMKPGVRLDFYPANELQKFQVLDKNTVEMTKRYRQASSLDFVATSSYDGEQGPLINTTETIGHLVCEQTVTLPADGTATEVTTDACARDSSVRHTSARERIDTLMVDGTTLFIQTHRYTNGHFSGTETIKLTRSH